MSIIGPDESCGPFITAADCSEFCSCRESEHHNKSVYQQACVSESTLSTSSVCPSGPYTSGHSTHDFDAPYMAAHSNPHELEPLNTLTGVPATTAVGSPSFSTSIAPTCEAILPQRYSNCKHAAAPSSKQCSSSNHQQGLGLIVSIQQSRQSKQQQQQNGSSAQLVVRKESTESQVIIVICFIYYGRKG